MYYEYFSRTKNVVYTVCCDGCATLRVMVFCHRYDSDMPDDIFSNVWNLYVIESNIVCNQFSNFWIKYDCITVCNGNQVID